jgi:translocation and assembly module TamB
MTPTKGTIGGQMTIHKAEVGPGPLAQQYLNMAKQVKDIADGNYAAIGSLFTPGAQQPPQPGAPTTNRGVLVLPEQQVKFEMIDGRVHHQGLQMTVKDVVITTRGSVGLDQTMELVAEIPVQDAWIGKNASLASLKGQMLQIPIRGTLSAPAPDYRGLTNLATSLGRSAATGLLEKKVGAELNKFLPPGFNPAAPAPGTAPAAPGTTPAPPTNPLDQLKGLFPR